MAVCVCDSPEPEHHSICILEHQQLAGLPRRIDTPLVCDEFSVGAVLGCHGHFLLRVLRFACGIFFKCNELRPWKVK